MDTPPAKSTLDYKSADVGRIRHRRFPLVEIGLATLVLLPVVYYSCFGLALVLPWKWETWVMLQYTAGVQPGAPGTPVVLGASTTGNRNQVQYHWVNVSVDGPVSATGPLPRRWILVDLDANTATYGLQLPAPATATIIAGPPPTFSQPMAWDHTCIINHLASLGHDPNAAATTAIADEIIAEMTKFKAGHYGAGTVPGGRIAQAGQTPQAEEWRFIRRHVPWFLPYSIVIWLIVSALSARAIVRWHHRREQTLWQRTAGQVQ